jgi:Tfp pilus assembly protein FimT
MKTTRGYTLLECLVYIAVFAVVLNLSFLAYYRYNQHSNSLRRNADDIVSALRAGERWRDDVRASTAPPRAIENGVLIPQRSGEVAYVFADGTIWRQTSTTRVAVLRQVKVSVMSDDSRPRVNAWRWELELASPKNNVLVRPLFSFTAVTGRQS